MASIPTSKEALGTAPITPLMIKLIIPAMMAQLINLLYSIVDRYYISQIPDIGEMALTGVGVASPVLVVVAAFASFAGTGSAPLASMAMGAQDNDRAEAILGNAFAMILVFSVGLTLFFTRYSEPVLYAFGASDQSIAYAMEYTNIYVLGTIFVLIALGLNPFISAQGQAKIAMLSVSIGAVVNIILDYLFIIHWNWGVKGAAVATLIAQACSGAWVLLFLCGKTAQLPLKKKYIRFTPHILKPALALGIAPFIMHSTESLITISLNRNLQTYGELVFAEGGDLYVGVMTIQQSVSLMIALPRTAMSSGTQPILGYNFGAKNYQRVREAFWKLIISSTIFSAISCLFVVTFPTLLSGIFTDDPRWLEISAQTMPIFFAGTWALGAQNSCQTTFLAMGQAKTSLFLAMLRKIILLAPLAYILPYLTGNVLSIFLAVPIADILTASVTFSVFLYRRKTLLPQEDK
ncbi:MAG: MATE family efflux transporter [Eubacteriales bacterium]